MCILKNLYFFIIFILINNINSFKINDKLSRRTIMGLTAIAYPFSSSADFFNSNNQLFKNLSPTFNNAIINSDDPYAHWSFFGLAPPPIEKVISYDELVDYVNNKTIFSVQIAVQHNCLIATTKANHRLACLVPDEKINDLIMDTMQKDGTLSFYILPIDPIRSKVRDIAQILFGTTIGLYTASELELIDIDTTPYGSIKEKDEFIKSGQKPKKLLRYMRENIFNNRKNTNNTNLNITDNII